MYITTYIVLLQFRIMLDVQCDSCLRISASRKQARGVMNGNKNHVQIVTVSSSYSTCTVIHPSHMHYVDCFKNLKRPVELLSSVLAKKNPKI